MNESAMLAIIVSVLIVSCTAVDVMQRYTDTPQSICVRKAFTQADRLACMGQKP